MGLPNKHDFLYQNHSKQSTENSLKGVLTMQSMGQMPIFTVYFCVSPEIDTVIQYSHILFHSWTKAFYNF
jgi:hypothetical protein